MSITISKMRWQKAGPKPSHKSALRLKIKAVGIGYFTAGFGVACWAPLIPIIKDELSLSSAAVAVLILAFGLGSLCGMGAAGFLTVRVGSRFCCALALAGSAASLISASFMLSYPVTLASVLCLGLCLGTLEVGINIYGAYLERVTSLRLLSPFHACYSGGEVGGAVLSMLLLSFELKPQAAAAGLFLLLLVINVKALPYIPKRLQGTAPSDAPFMIPKGIILILCIITASTYMTGGAMVDWSALYLDAYSSLDLSLCASGYAIVSASMLIMRVAANAVVRRLGAFVTAAAGAFLMLTGLTCTYLFPSFTALLLISFALIGIGMANITPLTLSACARQKDLPLPSAVATLSVAGFGALLSGPALLGLIASALSLKTVFLFLMGTTALSLILIVKSRAVYA